MASSNDQLINLQAQQLAAQTANWAAQLDFAKERFRLLELPEMQGKSQIEIDRLAFEKAQDTWKRAVQEATLTGTYNGQPTLEWLTQQAQLTGVLNGQQTLQGRLTDAQITQMNEQMRLANQQFLVQSTGYLDGRPTFEREQWQTGQTGYIGDQATMARQQMEANLSGYFNGRSTLDREKFGAEQTQNYLNLLSSLQGPGNAFKQMRVLGATDANLQNLVSGWAGTYNMPGFGSSGAPGQAQISDLWLGTGLPGSQPYAPNTGPPGMPGQWSPYGNQVQPPGGGAYVPPAGGPVPAAYQVPVPTYAGPAAGTPPTTDPAVALAPVTMTGPAAGVPLNDAELSRYEQILAREYQVLRGQEPSTLTPGSATYAELVGYLQRGAQNQSSTPLPNTPTGQAIANQVNLNVVGGGGNTSEPHNDPRPPTATGFDWTGQAAAAAAAASTAAGPPFASTVWQGSMNTDPAAAAAQAATNNVNVPGYTYSPQGVQAPAGAYNYSATDQGHTQVYPPGVAAPADQAQVSTQTPVSNSTANSLLATPMPGEGGSLSPNQINAENYQNMNPYAQDFLWAYFENQGWDKNAAKAEFMNSLPAYSGPAQGRVQI